MWDWQREKLGSGVVTTQASATPMEALSLRWPCRIDMSWGKMVAKPLYPHLDDSFAASYGCEKCVTLGKVALFN